MSWAPNGIHARLARVARQELAQRYATPDDQADAMAAAMIADLGLTKESGYREEGWDGVSITPVGKSTRVIRYVTDWECAE